MTYEAKGSGSGGFSGAGPSPIRPGTQFGRPGAPRGGKFGAR